METILDILRTCIPIIVGALIAIIPTAVQKRSEHKYDKEEKKNKKNNSFMLN